MRPLNLIVAGSRNITDQRLVDRILDKLRSPIHWVISGGARGIDNLGALWAEGKGHTVIHMPAKWDLHGKSAGYLRNVEMAKLSVNDPLYQGALVAIWDGVSPGTKHMINIANQHGMLVWVPDPKLF
jgi:hypothetical protein